MGVSQSQENLGWQGPRASSCSVECHLTYPPWHPEKAMPMISKPMKSLEEIHPAWSQKSHNITLINWLYPRKCSQWGHWWLIKCTGEGIDVVKPRNWKPIMNNYETLSHGDLTKFKKYISFSMVTTITGWGVTRYLNKLECIQWLVVHGTPTLPGSKYWGPSQKSPEHFLG